MPTASATAKRFIAMCLVVWAATSTADPPSALASSIQKTFGLHPQVVAATKALTARQPVTPEQRAAEALILRGGTYSVGALSLLVNEAAEDDVLAELTGDPGELRDPRAGAATRLFLELLTRFPLQQRRVLASSFPRDRLLALAAANGPQAQAAVASLQQRPLPARFLPVVEWLAAHRADGFDARALVERPGADAGPD